MKAAGEEEEGDGWGGDSWAIEWTRRHEDGTGGISLSAEIDVGTDGNRHGKGFWTGPAGTGDCSCTLLIAAANITSAAAAII